MSDFPIRYFPLGDAALTVEFGNAISEHLNDKAIALANAVASERFPWLIESVPAYASTTFFYDPLIVKSMFPDGETAFAAVREVISGMVSRMPQRVGDIVAEAIDITVDFGPDAALDLDYIADISGLDQRETIEIFTSREYRVYMLGFLPGFAYLGEVDERIAVPRRSSPRTSVPKGSVGIAGRQTGIYPLRSPGGWQIIGRTDLELFTPYGDTLTQLRPGDRVRFVPK
ncbi:MAG TPA: 5-oxoprolinase subunit PxpB [Pyrinomonadaceae bacterium]|nr:5-oxoprolinase subunit PxpB [Pyrinomonadaceae bacterium]HQX54994.1 5-oxoprolinase subunit PxpB [Pyrinomonadaceae bacterium]HQY68385.1 5-oxoprolinase subunit PxpB [Pyrinomonadaceae bacterium]HRA40097.1 5-oxoprolinase subunit PxpB [Pyrinomonadaceae bacterium]